MNSIHSTQRTSYDEVPYESFPFPQTHPDHLATLGRLFAIQPPPLERCRVLELGCASGGNLIPMAVAMPQAEFFGVDLSAIGRPRSSHHRCARIEQHPPAGDEYHRNRRLSRDV